MDGHLQTRLSQSQRRHKACSPALQVVIIVKMNRQTQAWAHALRFSSALKLPDDLWRDDDCLRVQIESNFREATQSWGLEDCMNVTKPAVTHAAHLALFMVNVAPRLRCDLRPRDPASGLLDLKAQGRGDKYVTEPINMLPAKPAPVVLAPIFTQVAG